MPSTFCLRSRESAGLLPRTRARKRHDDGSGCVRRNGISIEGPARESTTCSFDITIASSLLTAASASSLSSPSRTRRSLSAQPTNPPPPAKMHPISFLLPAIAAASPLVTQIAADQPAPNEIQILASTASGSGCDQKSYTYSISPDKSVS